MNLNKAREILELNIKEGGKQMPPDCKKALELGVEALKAITAHRIDFRKGDIYHLPGETNDNGGH